MGPAEESSEENTKKLIRKVQIDDILVEEIGQFGRYQQRVALLTAAVAVFAAWANCFTFTAARISTRCLIPECDPEDGNIDFAPPWILAAVPSTDTGAPAACWRFGKVTAPANSSAACPATFDPDILEPCKRNVYKSTNSVVYEFDLGCEEWRRSLIGSVRTFGVLVGLPVAGYVSDRFGRRTALAITSFNTAWIGLARLLTSDYIGFTVLEFTESALGSAYTCAYILVIELVGPRYRKVVAAAMNTFFTIGQAIMGLLAWKLQNWRHLTLALYVPQLPTVLYLWVLSESVRWYMSKGRYDESEAVLKNVARVNKKSLSEKTLLLLRAAEEERSREAQQDVNGHGRPWLILEVFKHKPILVRCLLAPVWWITGILVYYGLSINAVHLSGNGYLNYVAVSLVEIPGVWLAVLLLDKIGRKPVIIISYWICALCQIAYIFMPKEHFALSLGVYLVGKCSIAAVMSAIYTYTAELFPTAHRQSRFAYCSMMGRVGSVLAPLTPALSSAIWENFPFALFGAFSLVSGLLVFLTPETRGITLPDTMVEATNIRKIQKI